MEEMQRLISKRATEGTPRRPVSFMSEDFVPRSPEVPRDETARSMNEIAEQLESELAGAISVFDALNSEMRTALTQSFEVLTYMVLRASFHCADKSLTDF